jgi:hypothetical protein
MVLLPPTTAPSAFVFAAALPGAWSGLPGQDACSAGHPISGSPYVDANGISQVFRRSIPCLCSVPGPRSNRRGLAIHGHASAAPATQTTKASALADFGANPQLRHLLPYASRVALPHTCKARFRLAGSASTGWESNPLDRYERFQIILILLSCSPDATGCRLQSRSCGHRPRGSLTRATPHRWL